MKALILVNAYTQSEAELHQPRRIRDELSSLGVDVCLERNGVFAADERGAEATAREYAFCVYLDKDKYASRVLEGAGMRLFNRAQAIETCDDKFLTHLALSGSVPLPETYAAPLCYTQGVPVSRTFLDRVEGFGYPLVAKESFGSQGKGVYLVGDREELNAVEEKLQSKPHLYQRFIAESAGRDLRVIVIGSRAIGAMKRTGTDFRSNVGAGGRAEAVELDAEAKALSERAARLLKLDYCGVDLLFGKSGYLVCEVNSNAFFATFEAVTGINVAKAYAGYMLREIAQK